MAGNTMKRGLGLIFVILLLGPFSESRPGPQRAEIKPLVLNESGSETKASPEKNFRLVSHNSTYSNGNDALSKLAKHTSGSDVTEDIPAVDDVSAYIIGGADAAPGRWPWQALLRVNGKFVCGAVLIDKRYAITAAHCIRSRPQPSSVQVDLGVHNRMEEPLDNVRLDAYFFAPDEEDIAVLRFSREVSLATPMIQPIKLAPSDGHQYNEDDCWGTGWGMIGHNSVPRVLQEVSLDVLTYEKCRKEFGASIEETFVCAMGYVTEDRSMCQGDSGGPLSCLRDGTWYVAGVSSWTFGFCSPEKPSVFVRVSGYNNWINDVMTQN